MTILETLAKVTAFGWDWLIRNDKERGHLIHLTSPEWRSDEGGTDIVVWHPDLEAGLAEAFRKLPIN